MGAQLILIGVPGAGKTTIGAALAKKLGTDFIDTDRLIEKTHSKSVADIFVEDGEQQFRAWEREAVSQALAAPDAIVSLGGGSIINTETRAELADHNVAWLQVSLTESLKRVGMNQSRPLLLGNVRANMLNLMQQREPLYQSVATITVDTSGRDKTEIVSDLVAFLSEKAPRQ